LPGTTALTAGDAGVAAPAVFALAFNFALRVLAAR
jgi:hypothetical protein